MRAACVACLLGTLALAGAASSATSPGRTLTLKAPVRDLAADGYGAAMLLGPRKACHVVVWDARSGRKTTIQRLCVGSIRDSTLGVARAGPRVAWIETAGGNLLEEHLDVASAAHKKPVLVAFLGSGPDIDGDYLGQVKAAGRYVFFTTFHRCVPAEPDEPPNACPSRGAIDHGALWVYDPSSSGSQCPTVSRLRRCRLLDERSQKITLLAAGRPARAAARLPDGSIEILTASATLVHTFPTAPGPLEAALVGSQLFIRRGTALAVYAASGALVRTLTVPDARLAGGASGLAAFVAGRTLVLVGLANGRRTSIHVPGRGAVRADLESKGLFYSYGNRVRFLPRRALLARLASRRAPAPSKIVFESWRDGDFESELRAG